VAKVDVEREYPQISQPVGSKKEVEALGVPLRNIATCSVHTVENMGCPSYRICDREFKDDRPRNQIYQLIKRSGDIRTSCGACFDVVKLESQIEANGGLVKVVGGEGDKFKNRGSQKLHPRRNADCNDCASGKCEKYEDVVEEVVCKPFPPASEHAELVKFDRIREARDSNRDRSRKSLEAQLLGAPSPVVPKPEAPEDSRGGRTKP
jgi:hypothetical protein